MTQRKTTTEAHLTIDTCKEYLNQLIGIRNHIYKHLDVSNNKECIKDQVLDIVNNLDAVAVDITEILKQELLNANYFALDQE